MGTKQQKTGTTVSSFPRRSKGGNYSLYRLVSAVGLFTICCLLVIIAAQYIRQQQAREELEAFESQIREHEVRQEVLEAEIERLQDLEYIEILARRRLGLVKPGDIIFQLED